MHRYSIATRSELLTMLGSEPDKDLSAAEVDNALHAQNLMRLDACFPIGEQTLLITTMPNRIEDYRLVLPLLATRRVMHRIALVGEFEPKAMKVGDLAEIDRELLLLQEQHIETFDVYPIHQVYTFDRSNLISAVRNHIPNTGSVSHLTMWTAEYLTGINASDLIPPSASLITIMTESISGLVEQELNINDAMMLYWLDCNPEASMDDVARLGEYIGVPDAKERVAEILAKYS